MSSKFKFNVTGYKFILLRVSFCCWFYLSYHYLDSWFLILDFPSKNSPFTCEAKFTIDFNKPSLLFHRVFSLIPATNHLPPTKPI